MRRPWPLPLSRPEDTIRLLIYAASGMGKTHLMHAIGRSLLDNYGPMQHCLHFKRSLYERDDLLPRRTIACTQFHRHYRSADVLLIDDIQSSAGKERTQEEFFHTFNTLYEHEKQIVISSDSPSKALSWTL